MAKTGGIGMEGKNFACFVRHMNRVKEFIEQMIMIRIMIKRNLRMIMIMIHGDVIGKGGEESYPLLRGLVHHHHGDGHHGEEGACARAAPAVGALILLFFKDYEAAAIFLPRMSACRCLTLRMRCSASLVDCPACQICLEILLHAEPLPDAEAGGGRGESAAAGAAKGESPSVQLDKHIMEKVKARRLSFRRHGDPGGAGHPPSSSLHWPRPLGRRRGPRVFRVGERAPAAADRGCRSVHCSFKYNYKHFHHSVNAILAFLRDYSTLLLPAIFP